MQPRKQGNPFESVFAFCAFEFNDTRDMTKNWDSNKISFLNKERSIRRKRQDQASCWANWEMVTNRIQCKRSCYIIIIEFHNSGIPECFQVFETPQLLGGGHAHAHRHAHSRQRRYGRTGPTSHICSPSCLARFASHTIQCVATTRGKSKITLSQERFLWKFPDISNGSHHTIVLGGVLWRPVR